MKVQLHSQVEQGPGASNLGPQGTTPSAVSQALRRLAAFASIRGEAVESERLARAAGVLDAWAPDQAGELLHLAHAGRLGEVAGIEAPAASRVLAITRAGPLAVLQPELERIPGDLRRLIVSGGLPVEAVAALHRQLGITTQSELAAAFRDRLLDERVPAAARIARALRQAVGDSTRADGPGSGLPLDYAWAVITPILEALRTDCTHLVHADVVGSLRRVEPLIGELSLLCTATDPSAVVTALVGLPAVTDVLHRSRHKASVAVGDAQVDLKVASETTRGLATLWATGNDAHLSQLVRHAGAAGLMLRTAGLFRAGRPVARGYATDGEVYAALGLPFIAPELRQGTGEIQAAAAGTLPDLVTVEQIRGDLHLHSNWSDGHDPIESMVRAARDLGYEYVTLSDHSPSAHTVRRVDPAGLRRQADEIDRVRERVPGITILHGVEVDILADGSLDLDDATLARLDLVVASLHDAAGHSGGRLTERYVAAMRHPLVNIITHPTNRVVGHRAGYQLDVELLCATAVATGTALEIDGAPVHLDMDGGLARQTVTAGVTVTIDSDAHRASHLGPQMQYGVGMARRGWVEPRHVLNTRPLDQVRAWFDSKRGTARPPTP